MGFLHQNLHLILFTDGKHKCSILNISRVFEMAWMTKFAKNSDDSVQKKNAQFNPIKSLVAMIRNEVF